MAGGRPAAGYSIEIEPEVREWLQQCPLPECRAVERAADRLVEAVYARRSALGWTLAELAERAGLDGETVESIEESGIGPTLPLIERLAAAFDSVVRIDPAREPAITFEAHAA
ncbi:helix-turn-helix domain-containing protein [Kitasatospora sp. NPDC086801]|uniref:helix-turn-helix domain-containing protein n=1 Tax=Kitasatospora sp. NPDC086801 TaxID=3364066 RepID=UPI0038009421